MSAASLGMRHPHGLTRGEVALLTGIVAYSLVPAVGGLLRLVELAGGRGIVPANPRALADPWPLAAHVLGSVVFCILGALQFLPALRRRHPALHRRLGRVVALAGLTAAVTGMWMTRVFDLPIELQGGSLYWVRMALGAAMTGLICAAVLHARAGRLRAHRAAMLRAYAIGQGASTQALLGLAWMLVAQTELEGTTRDGMMVVAWAINALVAERLIRISGAPRRRERPRRIRPKEPSGHVAEPLPALQGTPGTPWTPTRSRPARY